MVEAFKEQEMEKKKISALTQMIPVANEKMGQQQMQIAMNCATIGQKMADTYAKQHPEFKNKLLGELFCSPKVTHE